MSGTLARRTGLLAIGQTAAKLTQLVVAVVLVRLLEPAAWNEAAFLLSIYLAGTMIGTLNLHHGIVFFLPRLPAGHHRRLVVRTVLLLLGVGALITLALTLAAPVLSGGRLGDAARLPYLGLAIAVELPGATVAMTLVAVGRFAAAAAWDLVGAAVVVTGAVLPVLGDHGVGGMVGGLVAAGAVRLAIGVGVVVAVLPRRDRAPAPRLMRSMLAYGLPLGLTLAVAMSNRLVDKWLIAAFRPGDFGVYAVAAQEIPLLSVLPYAGGTAVVATLVEAFRRHDPGSAHRAWLLLTSRMSLLVVPLSTALILIAPELLVLVFGAAFAAGVLPFQIFTAITLHRVAEYGMLLRAADRGRELVAVAIVTLVANLVLAAIGAASAGLVGASIGTLLASGLGWAVVLRRIARALDVPIGDAFAWRAWLRTLAIATAAAIAAHHLAHALTDDLLVLLLVKVATFAALVVPVLAGGHLRRPSAAARHTAVTGDELATTGRTS